MSQVVCLLKKRPATGQLLKRGSIPKAHIDSVLLRTNYLKEDDWWIKVRNGDFTCPKTEYLGSLLDMGGGSRCKAMALTRIRYIRVARSAKGIKKICQLRIEFFQPLHIFTESAEEHMIQEGSA